MPAYQTYSMCRLVYSLENIAKLKELGFTGKSDQIAGDAPSNSKPRLIVSFINMVYVPFNSVGRSPGYQPFMTMSQLEQVLLITDETVRATFINNVVRRIKQS